VALHQRRGIATAIAAVLIVAFSAGVASAASADDAPDGIGLTVTVTGVPGETPAPTNSAGGSDSGNTSGNGSNNGGNSGNGTVVKPDAIPTSPATPKPGEQSLGGILYVSGLSLEGHSSINPGATEAHLQFTVHNVSGTVIDGKAAFRVANVFGSQLGETRTVQIVQLKPDETRVVEATIRDVGQWGILHGSVVFTPPKEVEGVKLAPMTRENFFFILPWFTLIFAVLGVAAAAIIWVVRRGATAGAAAVIQRGSPA